MTLYEALLLIHIVMAIVRIGGGLAIVLLGLRAAGQNDWERAVALGGDAQWLALRLFMPASVLLLLSGAWAASEGNWSFGDAWITIGFAAILISLAAGIVVFVPERGRIGALARERGAAAPEVQRRIRRLGLYAQLELLMLIVVVWAMVAKPGL